MDFYYYGIWATNVSKNKNYGHCSCGNFLFSSCMGVTLLFIFKRIEVCLLQATFIFTVVGGLVKILIFYSQDILVITFADRHSQTCISPDFSLHHLFCCLFVESLCKFETKNLFSIILLYYDRKSKSLNKTFCSIAGVPFKNLPSKRCCPWMSRL